MFSLDHHPHSMGDTQWPLKPLFLARIIDISADGNWGVGRSKRSVGYRSSPSPPLGRCIIFTTKYWPAIVHPSTTAPSIFRTLGESPSSFHDFSFAAITWTTVMDWPVLDVKSWGRVGKNSVWLILRSVCQAVVSSYDRERERWKIILEALFDFFVRFSRKFFFFLCRIR